MRLYNLAQAPVCAPHNSAIRRRQVGAAKLLSVARSSVRFPRRVRRSTRVGAAAQRPAVRPHGVLWAHVSGGGDVFKDFTPKDPISLGSISDDKFMEAFDKYAIGDTSLALDLQCDGLENVLRGDLHLILFDVLGRNPSAEELDVFFTMTDSETSAAISRDEFLRSLAVLKERCANPKLPRSYVSHKAYITDLTKHRRLEYEPMESLRRPIKESQTIGWNSMASPNTNQKRATLNTTDVTRNEGIQPSNYFGLF